MTLPYTIVDVKPDTPEWIEERRGSVGASEVPAVLNLSPYNTPNDIYLGKMGVDCGFDPVLGYIGHASEPIIQGWVEQYSDHAGVKLGPGFMARSVESPWLHATFDRVAEDGTIYQFKTAHQYGGHHWNEGVPTDIRIQVQSEIYVRGADGEWVVVWIGGREFRMFWEARDEAFIRDHLIPQTRAFWEGNVLAGVAPPPSTYREAVDRFPGEEGETYELSDEEFANLEQRDVDAADQNHLKKRVEAFRDYVAVAVGNATSLTYQGRPAYTFKRQFGPPRVDFHMLEDDYPEAYEACVSRHKFPVLRKVKEKK